MAEQLKPCPFCDEPAFLEKFALGCDDCGLIVTFHGANRDEAIRRWNTRPGEVAAKLRGVAWATAMANRFAGEMRAIPITAPHSNGRVMCKGGELAAEALSYAFSNVGARYRRLTARLLGKGEG